MLIIVASRCLSHELLNVVLELFQRDIAIGCEEDSSDPQSWRLDEIDWTAGVFLKFSSFFDKVDLIELIGSIELIESLSDAVSRILVINTLRPPDSIFTCKDLGILRARMIATTLI
jgi:hypothetical protein